MKKHTSNESAFLNPRVLAGLLLGVAGISLAMLSLASTPSTGTLTDISGPLTYTAGPFNQPNQSPAGAGQLDIGPRCGTSGFPCDNYLLTITLPSGYNTTHPSAAVKVTAGWVDKGTGQSDYDLYIYKGNVATTDGNQLADYQSASGSNPEIATIFPLVDDGQPHQYSIKLVPYMPTGETLNVKIEFFPGAVGSGGGGGGGVPFGGADPTVAGQPRYINFYAPKGSSAESSTGEYNIGFNPATGRIMNMNSGPIWRITPPELLIPAKPECCEGLWEDKSFQTTNTGLDPILWTDQKSGRTFASNTTTGASALYGYSDNDGDLWNPVSVSPIVGADHQTIATGPYPAALAAANITPLNQGQYTLYCSQDLVGANCNRSDDLGSVWGPAIVATGNGTSNTQGCGGLHGHVHVAPDGTAYLPDKSCGSVSGGSFTLDAGTLPWTEFQVKKTVADANGPAFTATPQADGADPSIAIDSNNTLYYCYVNNQANGTEGHLHIATGKRVGSAINWIRDTDVGTTHGVVNAAHPEAVGGTTGRAACGFFGTNVPGDYENGNFGGTWYAFIATTYDEGVTWTTVNATPNDPVQSMTGIWQRGGAGDQGDRNLLDFNEITTDDKGHVLYGYSDGCTSVDCIGGTAKSNLGAAMRVARQSGGKPLFQQFDPVEPAAPRAACLSGTRDLAGAHLTWKAPDNGGADISSYQILRSTTAGNEVQIATYSVGPNSKREYTDATADPSVAHYFYKIIAVNPVNAAGGPLSNEVDLPIVIPAVQDPCVIPGLTELTDPAGDSIGGPGTDLLSFSLAQPYASDNVVRLAFTIKIDPTATAAQAPGTFYYVVIKFVNGATTTYKGVRMVYSGATPTFESYTPSGNSSGSVDGRFVTSGSSVPAEASSSYTSSTGNILIVVKASDLGLSVGSAINGFVSGVAQPANPSGVGANAVALFDQMPDSLAYTGSYVVTPNGACAPLQSAVSRKHHGTAGDFDIPLPITGSPGEETRGTGTTGNSYSLIFTFASPVTAPGTATTSQGSASTAAGPNANQVTVALTGVNTAQHLTVGLTNVVSGGSTLTGLSVPMDVLVGDVNGSGNVDSADVTVVQRQNNKAVNASNFRTDVNASGNVDSADVTITQRQNQKRLP